MEGVRTQLSLQKYWGKKNPAKYLAGSIRRRLPTLPGLCPSTIGHEGLNCSVRNGKR